MWLEVWANEGFVVQDPSRRESRYRRIRSDGLLADLENSFWAGFDVLPQDVSAVEVAARLE